MADALPGKSREPSRKVWLRLIGTLDVSVGGVLCRPADIGSRKARTVLALLALRPDRHVPVEDIVAVLWTGRPPRGAVGNISTLVSRLRATIRADVIQGQRGRYRLGSEVAVDLHSAAELVHQAEAHLAKGNFATALLDARCALRLVGDGTVLAEYPDAQWAEPTRMLVSQLIRRARLVTAETAVCMGDMVAAAEAAELVVAADSLDEAACRAMMRAYAAAGEPVRALAAFAQLRTALADELGIDPAPMTSEMHVAILRGAIPSYRRTGAAAPR